MSETTRLNTNGNNSSVALY